MLMNPLFYSVGKTEAISSKVAENPFLSITLTAY
jgi:hypothetical protein